MKTIALLLIAFSSFAQVAKQASNGMWYMEYKDPACATLKCKKILFLHGSGERGDGTTSTLYKVQAHGLPKKLKEQSMQYLPGSVVYCPQQTTNNSGWVTNPNDPTIIKLLKYFHKDYVGDSTLFITGISMGAGGVWDASYSSFLDESCSVTAIIPVSGSGDYNGAKVTAQRKIPAWVIHKDTAITPDVGYKPVRGMNDVQANPAPIWTLIKGGTHSGSTWDVAYSLTQRAELGGTTIYDWMDTFRPQQLPPPTIQPDTIAHTIVQPDGKFIYVGKSGKIY